MTQLHAWFDIDDTILANHHLYQHAKAKAAMALMEIDRYLNSVHDISIAIDTVDKENIATMGLSMHRFPKSVLEGVITYAQHRGRVIPEQYHQRFVEIGEEVFSSANYVQLMPGAREVLEKFTQDYTVHFVTEGDPVAQQRKVDALSLNTYGQAHIFPRKRVETLSGLAQKINADPQKIVFIGNSLRSDIIPSSSIGCATVYIPFESWNAHHPPGDVIPPKGPRHFEFDEISQVLQSYDAIRSSLN